MLEADAEFHIIHQPKNPFAQLRQPKKLAVPAGLTQPILLGQPTRAWRELFGCSIQLLTALGEQQRGHIAANLSAF
jgi:hypothetical protein